MKSEIMLLDFQLTSKRARGIWDERKCLLSGVETRIWEAY